MHLWMRLQLPKISRLIEHAFLARLDFSQLKSYPAVVWDWKGECIVFDKLWMWSSHSPQFRKRPIKVPFEISNAFFLSFFLLSFLPPSREHVEGLLPKCTVLKVDLLQAHQVYCLQVCLFQPGKFMSRRSEGVKLIHSWWLFLDSCKTAIHNHILVIYIHLITCLKIIFSTNN